jgi:hypothetical protein
MKMKKTILMSIIALAVSVAFVSGAMAVHGLAGQATHGTKLVKFSGLVEKVDEANKDFALDLHQQRMTFYLDKNSKITEAKEGLPFVDMSTDTPFDWLWASAQYEKEGAKLMAERINVDRLW